MEQRERTMKKGATKVTAIALAIAAVMALALCGCASQGDIEKRHSSDRTNAKQVIMAGRDLFTMMNLGLTDADSPATISQNDPFAEFWSELLQYKKVADLDVQNAEIVTDITAVEGLPQHARTALRRTTATP